MSFYTVVSILFLVFVLCGSSIAKRDSRILGGTTAANGQYPYQVSLRTQGSHFCGGSILSTRWILTAAHCLQSIVGQISVVVGTNVISSGGDTYLAEGYIIHPLFVSSSRLYDAALVNTTTAIVYSSKVQPVSLTTLVPVDAAVAVITGWGSESDESGDYVDNLKTLNVIVINETSCSVISHGFTHLCTVSPSGGACWYDDGGPVTVCNLQIGIVSYTLCAQSIPDAHTKISSVYGWIMSYMSTNDVSQ